MAVDYVEVDGFLLTTVSNLIYVNPYDKQPNFLGILEHSNINLHDIAHIKVSKTF